MSGAGGSNRVGVCGGMTVDFGSYAQIYQRHRRTQPVVLAELLRCGQVSPGQLVLEVGCGTAN